MLKRAAGNVPFGWGRRAVAGVSGSICKVCHGPLREVLAYAFGFSKCCCISAVLHIIFKGRTPSKGAQHRGRGIAVAQAQPRACPAQVRLASFLEMHYWAPLRGAAAVMAGACMGVADMLCLLYVAGAGWFWSICAQGQLPAPGKTWLLLCLAAVQEWVMPRS